MLLSFIVCVMQQFETLLQQKTQAVEALLDDVLSTTAHAGEIRRPERLVAAMRYAVLSGGKRVRPFLLMEVAALLGASGSAALLAATSLELLHSYSLIHDDLPSMDDDDWRRGRPTVHKQFDEATAILAGDALLTLAFELLADLPDIEAKTALLLVKKLAQAGGLAGMVGGQMLDLSAQHHPLDAQAIITMQAMKTGALIRYACEAGALLAQAKAKAQDVATMIEFGQCLGLAFQLADDLLDITTDSQTLGKTAGKDVKAGKATLVALNGQDWARAELARLANQAQDLLAPFGAAASLLRQTAHFIVTRKN